MVSATGESLTFTTHLDGLAHRLKVQEGAGPKGYSLGSRGLGGTKWGWTGRCRLGWGVLRPDERGWAGWARPGWARPGWARPGWARKGQEGMG